MIAGVIEMIDKSEFMNTLRKKVQGGLTTVESTPTGDDIPLDSVSLSFSPSDRN